MVLMVIGNVPLKRDRKLRFHPLVIVNHNSLSNRKLKRNHQVAVAVPQVVILLIHLANLDLKKSVKENEIYKLYKYIYYLWNWMKKLNMKHTFVVLKNKYPKKHKYINQLVIN